MNVQENLVEVLREKNLKIATAESCTGGLLSEMITDVSGASRVFECGVCSYSNEIKISVLHVKKETIDKYTEVSVQTAEEMAKGVLEISGADIAVSTTGVAGPTGGSDLIPLGTVCFGFYINGALFGEKIQFGNIGRNNVREAATDYVFKRLNELL